MSFRIVFVVCLFSFLGCSAFGCKKPAPAAAPAGQGAGKGAGGRGAAPEKPPEMDAESQRYASCVAAQCKSGSTVCQQQCARAPDDSSWEKLPEASTTDSIVYQDPN